MTEQVMVPSEKTFLTASEILEAQDAQSIDVLIPEWGDKYVRLRSLSAEEALSFVAAIKDGKRDESSIRIVALTAVNENNERLFTEEHIQLLKTKNFRAILRLQEAAMNLNGLTAWAAYIAKNA